MPIICRSQIEYTYSDKHRPQAGYGLPINQSKYRNLDCKINEAVYYNYSSRNEYVTDSDHKSL